MIVKSWTRDTRVNGSTISEAWLRIGDLLSLGSLSFEVLPDETTASPVTKPTIERHSSRAVRRKSNRRIRNLLDVVRQQKNSFESLQAKLDHTESLVDDLMSRDGDPQSAQPSTETEPNAERAHRRKRGNDRVRLLLGHIRELISTNEELQAELREQLEIKQNQLNDIRRELAQSADATEQERAQQRRLESELGDAQEMIEHLQQQAVELETRETELRDQWTTSRKHSNGRVRSLLSHLRTMRDALTAAQSRPGRSQEKGGNGAVSRLTELRLAYDDAARELQENRDSLKETQSELAWSLEELEQSQQHSEELNQKIAALEHALAEAREAESVKPSADQEETLAQLRKQLDTAASQEDQLRDELNELRQQNEQLQQTISEQQQIEQDWKTQLADAQQQCATIREQLEAQREAADARRPADSDLEESEEQAMEHLRSMGILREAESSHPFEKEANEPAEETRAVDPNTGLTSSLNFQFPEETEEESSAELPSQGEALPEEPAAEVKSSPEASDDDTSIDDYMQNLLARMRAKSGTSSLTPSADPPKAAEPKPAEVKEVAREEEKFDPLPDEEFRPSHIAPEQTSDIRKLRELANETAKAAIDSATLNRWESLCKSKLIVSMAALGSGLWLHYLSPSYMSLSFMSACMAYVITVFWWLQSAVIYQHVKKNRRERLEKRFNDEIIAPHGLSVPSSEEHSK